MRLRLAVPAALALALLGSGAPSGAHHGTSPCSVSGLTDITDSPQVSVINARQTQSWKVTVPAGQHYVWVQPLNGDVWMQVCKAGEVGVHACEAGNFGNLPELCIAQGLQGNPGAGRPLIGPGSFRVLVKHCFELDSSAGVCDYGQGLVAPGQAPDEPIVYTAVAH